MPTLCTLEPSELQLPCCTLHKRGLELDESASDSDFNQVGKTLGAIGQCGLWWWGDYLCYAGKRKGETYTEGVVKDGYDPGTLRVAKWLCNAIPLLSRDNEMSFSHHREALLECKGDVSEALEWVTKARGGKWSVAFMRAEIRNSKRGHTQEEHEKAQHGVYDYIKEVKRVLRTELENATPEYLDAVEEQLNETLEMVREARRV